MTISEIKGQLVTFKLEDLLYHARDRGYRVYVVEDPESSICGQYTISGSRVTAGEDRWMQAVKILLREKQREHLSDETA